MEYFAQHFALLSIIFALISPPCDIKILFVLISNFATAASIIRQMNEY